MSNKSRDNSIMGDVCLRFGGVNWELKYVQELGRTDTCLEPVKICDDVTLGQRNGAKPFMLAVASWRKYSKISDLKSLAAC
eukprot:1657627-Rhodomonas_salina.1